MAAPARLLIHASFWFKHLVPVTGQTFFSFYIEKRHTRLPLASPPYIEGRLLLERGECTAKAQDRLHARPPIRKIDELEGGD